jgi:hypothetical protein
MAANVTNRPAAITMSVYLVRAFVQQRVSYRYESGHFKGFS